MHLREDTITLNLLNTRISISSNVNRQIPWMKFSYTNFLGIPYIEHIPTYHIGVWILNMQYNEYVDWTYFYTIVYDIKHRTPQVYSNWSRNTLCTNVEHTLHGSVWIWNTLHSSEYIRK